jgi:hypothetical protein
MPQAIDTLKLFDTLKKSFTEEQAHLLSHTIAIVRDETAEEVLATKKDIKELEAITQQEIRRLEFKIAETSSNLELKIAETSSNLELKIAETSSNLELKIAEVKTQIAQSKAEILKWMVGFLLAQTGIIAALVKLL